jgi:hypothetical protein
MGAGNREALRLRELRAGSDSGDGLQLLQSLLLELEHQLEAEGSAATGSGHQGPSEPVELLEPLDKEAVVRKLIQRFRGESGLP